MRGFIAYSQPRGMYGPYVFTVLIYFSFPTETVKIDVRGGHGDVYSCHSCGKWASITIKPSEVYSEGLLVFYRFDNVKPDDDIWLNFIDSELLYYQKTHVRIQFKGIAHGSFVYRMTDDTGISPVEYKGMYETEFINWDEYLAQRSQGSLRIEEELIQQTMNAEEITLTELRLEPARQLPAVQGQQQFIEGELRYLTD